MLNDACTQLPFFFAFQKLAIFLRKSKGIMKDLPGEQIIYRNDSLAAPDKEENNSG